LRDDEYCIVPTGIRGGDDVGTCFRVTGYHVNDMWAELHADTTFAHDGDELSLDASAGYFSGGPAADVPITIFSALQPKQLGEAYPQFTAYTFAQANSESGGQSFDSIFPKAQHSDTQGHAHARVKLVADDVNTVDSANLVPFGTLSMEASAGLSGATSAVSKELEVTFSRHARYVGLQVEPWTLHDDADPEISTVVISERGVRVPDARVHVEILELERDAANPLMPMKPGKLLAQCEVRTEQKTACPFRAPHSGSYRFRVSSEGAAPAMVDRYAAVGAPTIANVAEAPHTRLNIANATVAVGDSAQLVLQQPFTKAMILFSIEHGRVLKHWQQSVDTPLANIALPVEAEWAPGVTLHATVLDAAGDPFGENARLNDIVQGASVDIHVTAPKHAAPLVLELAQSEAKPGAEITFTLRNQSPRELQLTLAVVDDAALALVPEFVTAADPSGTKWLGLLNNWNQTWWYSLADLPRLSEEARQLALASPIQPSSAAVSTQKGQALDTIVVTGSNIRRVDIYTRSPAQLHGLANLPHGSNLAHGAMRARFSESALWDADSTLATGAARTVHLRLPDNLTRWRIMAWANDADDTFTLAQATVAAALPVETRTELPTRLFPGDEAQLGANVRNHGAAPRTLDMRLSATGAGVSANSQASAALAPHAQQRMALLVRPSEAGTIEVETRAGDAANGDALASSLEVASPVLHQRVPVAGWLTSQGVSLPLPLLPGNASHAQLRIEAASGLNAFAKTWIDALHEYPHRCWEQILSRTVGAAAAKQLDLGAAWPDADEVVNDTLRVAGQYQDRDGHFHFFPSSQGVDVSAQSPFLTAYTVRVFAFLKTLGYKVPQVIDDKAHQALQQAVVLNSSGGQQTVPASEEFALMAGELAGDAPLDAKRLDGAWSDRSKLTWSARASLARTLTLRPQEKARAAAALQELRDAGSLHGVQRVVGATDTSWTFASTAADQCEVAAVLAELDKSDGASRLRSEYLRGIADLYAGGAAARGTQPSARCLMSVINHASPPQANASLHVDIGGAASGALDVAPHTLGTWSGAYTASGEALTLHSDAPADALLSYVANVEFDVDGRHAQPSAVGLGIERSYAVLRDKHWQPLPAAAVHEGDWVQVTLRVSTLRVRHFVAITDSVAGGLRPTDLQLSGVADLELRRLATPIDPYFAEHQIDDRYARFYAEQLSPGTHELHYYARAAQRGTYSTLPAVAELMYGSASVARTESGSVRIVK